MNGNFSIQWAGQHLDSAPGETPTNHPLAIQASSPPKPKIIVKTQMVQGKEQIFSF